jgi:hypothetical protein
LTETIAENLFVRFGNCLCLIELLQACDRKKLSPQPSGRWPKGEKQGDEVKGKAKESFENAATGCERLLEIKFLVCTSFLRTIISVYCYCISTEDVWFYL